MLEVDASLALAGRVVARLKKIWPKKLDAVIASWANGREQGLSVRTTSWTGIERQIVVAQHRSGEDILIVAGPTTSFDARSNHPDEKIWETPGARVRFPSEHTMQAARFILKFFRATEPWPGGPPLTREQVGR